MAISEVSYDQRPGR